MGSYAITGLEAGGGSGGGLEDADGVICLRPTEKPGLLLDRIHHRQKRFQLNVTIQCSWSFREAFVVDIVGGSTGCDAPEEIQHFRGFRNP